MSSPATTTDTASIEMDYSSAGMTLERLSGFFSMTPKQFQTTIDRLGLSQVAAAKLVGADPRTSRKWAAGDNAVPECVAILLRLMLAGKVTAGDIDAVRK